MLARTTSSQHERGGWVARVSVRAGAGVVLDAVADEDVFQRGGIGAVELSTS